MKINRREFVGGLSAAVAATAVSSFAIPRRALAAKTVDVYFHGLWIFANMGGVTKAYAPCSQMHCYMIGRDRASLVDLDPGNYNFSIPSIAGAAKFNAHSNKIDIAPSGMSALAKIDRSVIFPHQPRAIQSYRLGTATYADGSTAPYSLVQKLTFDFDQTTVSFGPTWTSTPAQQQDTLNLYAEVSDHETSGHALFMMNAVATLLKLPWKLATSTMAQHSTDPNLMGLPELQVTCKSPGNCKNPLDTKMAAAHGKTVRSTTVRNCMPIVIQG